MKIIQKIVIPLFLVVTLAACNVSPATPNPLGVMETAISVAQTEVIMTQTAMPTATWIMPTATVLSPTMIIPTITLPPPTIIPFEAYKDKVGYAEAKAKETLLHLPYVYWVDLFKLYSGCVETNDFQSMVTYTIHSPDKPIDVVKTAFEKFFQTEGWEVTDVTSKMINNAVQTRYDLYRMLPKDLFLERMVVTFMDDSAFVKSNHISVRVVLTHIETKENFGHIVELNEIQEIYIICQNSWPD